MGDNTQNPEDLVQNPIGEELQVEVSIPKKIEIKMVDASSLSDYEVWIFLSSIACDFLVGFVVATITANDNTYRNIFIAVDIFFLVIVLIMGWMALRKRKGMTIETNTIPLSVKKKNT